MGKNELTTEQINDCKQFLTFITYYASCHDLVPVLNSQHLEDSEKGMSEILETESIFFVFTIRFVHFVLI